MRKATTRGFQPTQNGCDFEKKPADYVPVKGDVAFWNFSSQHTGSHVSIVMEDGVHNGRITVLSQNPNPAQRMSFDLTAFLGYLHPKALGEGGGTTSTEKNPTGDNSHGSADSARGGAWIHWQGDNLYLHESDNTGSRTRIFYKTTANNFPKSVAIPAVKRQRTGASLRLSVRGKFVRLVCGRHR